MFTPEHAIGLFTIGFLLLIWAELLERKQWRNNLRILRKYVGMEAREAQNRQVFLERLGKEIEGEE